MDLLPRPRHRKPGSGELTLDSASTLAADAASQLAERHLREVLGPATGFSLPAADPTTATVGLRVDPSAALPTGPGGDRSESFTLTITAARVEIVGGGPAGVFYGVQALVQLLPAAVYRRGRVHPGPWTLPALTVRDAPAFAWRGLLLDVVRHFVTPPEVRRIIDQMAAHRLNRLHLHLTDDQGWRLEIRRYPRLTEVGGWRTESQVGAHVRDADGTLRPDRFDGRPHGGYYSQADIAELVGYAADRFITVVPEIETPGHVRAALAAYPELGVTGHPVEVWTEWGVCEDVLNAEDSTIAFFTHVFDEVVELFPSHDIGVGGDECPKGQWENDPRTQERMRQLGLRDPEQVQGWIIGQLARHLESHGRRAIGWDEILEGGTVPTSAVVLSWRGLQGAVTAATRGHDVVSVPADQAYLDFRQSELASEPIPVAVVVGVEDVYAFDPVPPALAPAAARHILGGQANLWTEHLDSARALDYQLFPRLAALAEALWSADLAGPRDAVEFRGRLAEHLTRLTAMGVEFRGDTGPRPWQQRPGVPGRPASRGDHDALITDLTANITD